jgi:hypothetical protein
MEEKREAVRKTKRMLLKIEDGDAVLIDVSRKGMRISAEKIPEGETVEISFKMNNRRIRLKGTVHWVEIKQTVDEDPYELGVSFKNPSREFLQFVDNL